MAYERRILHYASDCTTLIQQLSGTDMADPRSISCWFELLRIGGCGAGEVQLKDKFTLRGDIEIGDHIAIEYAAGIRWYFGRVEEVEEESPKGVRVSLFGLWAYLSEVYPGGYGDSNYGTPYRLARSDWFTLDPDHALQSWSVVSQPQEIVRLLWQYHINPTTCIALGPVEDSAGTRIDSFTYRGEESVAEVLRTLANIANGASVGVDEWGVLHFLQKRATVIKTFQEGVDLEHLARTRDRSLLYNAIQLTGDNIYTTANIACYRYRTFMFQPASVARYGLRMIKIYVPWIRRNEDARQFAAQFFREYANPTTKYDIRTNCQGVNLRPWDGQIQLLAADGSHLVTQQFDRVRVQMDHCPIVEIQIGPEDVQYPPTDEDQRRELPTMSLPNGESSMSASISSLGTQTGTLPTSEEASQTVPSSDSSSADVVCYARSPQAANFDRTTGAAWIDPDNVFVEDAANAYSDPPAAGGNTATLVARSLGFTTTEFPDSATIVGVILRVKRKALIATGSNNVVDYVVKLVTDGATPTGIDRSSPNSWPLALEYAQYGGVLDDWGVALTPAIVRSPNFGVAIAADTVGPAINAAYIDHIEVIVCARLAESSSSQGGECVGGYDTFVDVEGTPILSHALDVDPAGTGWEEEIDGSLVISAPDPGASWTALVAQTLGTWNTVLKTWVDVHCRITMKVNRGAYVSNDDTFIIYARWQDAGNHVRFKLQGHATIVGLMEAELVVWSGGSIVAIDTDQIPLVDATVDFDMVLELQGNEISGWAWSGIGSITPLVYLDVAGTPQVPYHGLSLQGIDKIATQAHIQDYCVEPLEPPVSSSDSPVTSSVPVTSSGAVSSSGAASSSLPSGPCAIHLSNFNASPDSLELVTEYTPDTGGNWYLEWINKDPGFGGTYLAEAQSSPWIASNAVNRAVCAEAGPGVAGLFRIHCIQQNPAGAGNNVRLSSRITFGGIIYRATDENNFACVEHYGAFGLYEFHVAGGVESALSSFGALGTDGLHVALELVDDDVLICLFPDWGSYPNVTQAFTNAVTAYAPDHGIMTQMPDGGDNGGDTYEWSYFCVEVLSTTTNTGQPED